ncbi:hypothetical protein CDAR_418711 [Caerostris darwini]|uniref:Uncharacterized protein n=1 Tax=Caerostris darwini TaxID=1538125 RepID=A0AAV4MX75_9ARAC|nr:hypothetical protein CDAR_418711 [Caerostris darwini]
MCDVENVHRCSASRQFMNSLGKRQKTNKMLHPTPVEHLPPNETPLHQNSRQGKIIKTVQTYYSFLPGGPRTIAEAKINKFELANPHRSWGKIREMASSGGLN